LQQDVKNTSFSKVIATNEREPNPEKRSITTPHYQIEYQKKEKTEAVTENFSPILPIQTLS